MAAVGKVKLQEIVDTAEDAQLAYDAMADAFANWADADADEKDGIREEMEEACSNLLAAAEKLRELHAKATW